MSKLLLAASVWGLSAYVALAAAGNQDLPQLFRAAGTGDEPARLRAIDTLGERREAASKVVPVLSKQLTRRFGDGPAHAAHALGRLGPAARPAVGALAPLLADPETQVRRAAVRAWLRIRPGPPGGYASVVQGVEGCRPGRPHGRPGNLGGDRQAGGSGVDRRA